MNGLVLEGGAMRGMFTAGVIDVFMEEGISFDGTVGVSAGATFGCNIKSRQIGRSIRYNRRFAKEPNFGSFRSLRQTGDYYNQDFCYRRVPEELDPFDYEEFGKNPMRFYVVATNIETGKPAYRELTDCREEDMRWIQASASMPFFARPVEIRGKKYLDGGISDSIPLRFMERMGYDKIVVVLTRPLGYRKKKSRLQPLMDSRLKEMPSIAAAMRRRPERYNRTLDLIREKENAGEIFVIRPPEKLPVSRLEHDPEKMQQAYETGRAEAERQLSALKAFLAGEKKAPSDADRASRAVDVLPAADAPEEKSVNEEMRSAEQIVEELKRRGWHISFAESCTGGMAAAHLVDVASASEVFDGSFVTYSNENKVRYLGVREETIAAHGVVSEEVAAGMAEGTARAQGAEVGVGITGVAGPAGGTESKPVGMVCFGFFVNGEMHTFTCRFGNIGRNEVRKASVDFVYRKLEDLLRGNAE